MMKSLLVQTAFILFAFSAFAFSPKPGEPHATLAIGSKAPDFTLMGVDGKMYSLKDFSKAKILMIVFMCDHCPTAQAYEDTLMQFVKEYKSKGVDVVAISPNDSKSIRLDEMGYTDLGDSYEDMKIRAKDKQFNYTYLFDGETSATSLLYGPQATPHVFLFDKDRILRYTGRIDDGLGVPGKAKSFDTRTALNEMVAGQPVVKEKTKTFGCSVKWPEKHDLVNQEEVRWAKEKVTLQEINLDSVKALFGKDNKNYRLINVWATWCGPCVSEFSDFMEINHMYRLREFELVTISMDDTTRKENVLNFLTKKQASSANYILTGDKYQFIDQLDKDWQGSLPYTILLAPGGKVLYSKQGMIDPLELKKLIVNSMGRVFVLPANIKIPQD
jgi:peroxiredoxin